jgi:hypothetical protein
MQALGQAGTDLAQFLRGRLAVGAQPNMVRSEVGDFLP